MANIVWLKEIGKNDVSVAGGKGANLAEMYNIGLPVPLAFIITAQAYSYFIEKAGLRNKIMSILKEINIDDTQQLEDKSKSIRELIIHSRVPDDLKEEILEAYDIVNVSTEIAKGAEKELSSLLNAAKEPAFVSVRSSATAEDLETASFAGQQETYLNVRGNDDLIDKIKCCWASLFTARAVYYREKKNFEHEKVLIAVVVQRMINSDKSGVAFTLNPSTNKDEIVIEAGFGLGEGIVSGSIAPDNYVVDKKTLKIIEKNVKTQNLIFKRDSSGKTVKTELESSKRNQQVMNDREIFRLSGYIMRIEDHYKKPQDIEFAIEGADIYILQSRPVTTAQREIKAEKIKEGKILIEGLPASPGIAFGIVKIIAGMNDLPKIRKGDILVTAMTNPDMVVTMQKSSAIVTDEGGMTAHAAIVSREMGIPCVVGTMKATSTLIEGQIVTVDGYNGKVYEGKVKAESKQAEKEEREISAEEFRPEHDEKTPLIPVGTRMPKIYMNLSEPEKINQYKNLRFDGIGLMRLEFIIASQIRTHPLSLIEQNKQDEYINRLAKGIGFVAKTINPKPVIVRFSDFKTNEYRDLEGGDKFEMEESNPMLGFRGVSRYTSEQFKEAFKLECRAVKKIRQENKNVWVMIPFVRKTSEVLECLKIMREEGLERCENFKIFLMAEVPSMAFIAQDFARLPVDGASIGSNDLTQLVLGVDRDSAILGRMGYFDEMDKAVLKSISNIIYAFRKENKLVSICGQAPSVYPEMVKFLLHQGISSISVNPDVVNSVRERVMNELRIKDA